MLLNIIFSFNRAMQLDLHLRSSKKHIKYPHLSVIVYHTTGKHFLGYLKLIEEYKCDPSIIFIERKEKKVPTYDYIKFFKQFTKDVKNLALQKNDFQTFNNFKSIVEQSINISGCDLVMFNTDDGIWTDDVFIEDEIKNLIIKNGYNTSIRYYVGDNLRDFPSRVKKWGEKYYMWNYLVQENINHWNYPFAIDATVYSSKHLYEILRNVFYSNPIELESNVVAYCLKKRFLGIGLSELQSKVCGTVINRVSTTTANPAVNVDIEFLNTKFLEGYELDIEIKEPINIVNNVPEKVYITKNGFKTLIYEINDAGREINNNY